MQDRREGTQVTGRAEPQKSRLTSSRRISPFSSTGNKKATSPPGTRPKRNTNSLARPRHRNEHRPPATLGQLGNLSDEARCVGRSFFCLTCRPGGGAPSLRLRSSARRGVFQVLFRPPDSKFPPCAPSRSDCWTPACVGFSVLLCLSSRWAVTS